MDLKPRLFILTAPIGAGKTTFCRALADRAGAAGWDVAGILCPAFFEDSVKTGILAQDLRSGEARLLAVSTHQPINQALGTQSDHKLFNLKLGNWLFSTSTLTWGREIIAASLPTDLLIVDELGPLELVRGEGWANALDVLRQPAYKAGVIVIRPSLLTEACSVLDVFEVIQADMFIPTQDWVQTILLSLP